MIHLFSWFKKYFNYFFASIILIYRLIICFSYRPELSIGESNNIWNAIKTSLGKPFYSNPEQTPFEVLQYTPLSQLPIYIAARIYPSNALNYIYYITVTGRIIELIFNCIACYFFFKLIKLSTLFSTKSAFFIGIFGFSILTQTAFTIRPDSLSLLCIILCLYFFYSGYINKQKSTMFLAYTIATCSFFVKQDSFFIIFPIGLFLLISKDFKLLIYLNLYFLVLLFLLIVTFDYLLGEYFLYSIIYGVKNPATLEQAVSVLKRTFTIYNVLFLFANLTLIYALFKPKDIFLKLIISVCFIFEIIAFGTSLKVGSWVNYYIPFILFSSIICLYYMSKVNLVRFKQVHYLFAIFFSVIFIANQIYNYTSPYLKINASKKEYLFDLNEFKRIKMKFKIKETDKIFISEPIGRNYFYKNAIFINTEYFEISPFQYNLNFNKKIKLIITTKERQNSTLHISNKFKINLTNYKTDTTFSLKYIIYSLDSNK